MMKEEVLFETENYIRQKFEEEGSGHDWWHIDRVRKLALKIGKKEGADLFLVELAALLHDLDDWKLKHLGDGENEQAERWLNRFNLEKGIKNNVLTIVRQVSFKGAGVETCPETLEGKVVQDADRLDAIGAIGIARTFAYGGNKKRLIYDPDVSPGLHGSFEEYKKSESHTINHFYEKLLLLKERMNTETAKEIAEVRHQFMEGFLQQFYNEWKLID